MAHELTLNKRTGQYEMAFVGATPWHHNGQRVTRGAKLETWAQEAYMQWTAERSVVQYMTPEGLRESKGDHIIYRSDTGARVGLVSEGYKIVQPIEVLEFFRDLTEAGDWHIHTAGTMKGGSRIWALASNHTEGQVVKGDSVRGNLLLATSLDGTLKTTAAMTAIRVVCANTLKLALSGLKKADGRKKGIQRIGADKDGKTTAIAVSHRSEFDASAVKAELGLARESFEVFMQQARQMAETPIGQEEAREVLRQIFGQPKPVKTTDEPVAISGGAIDGSDFAQLLARPHAAVEAPKEQRNIPKVLELFGSPTQVGTGKGADHPGVAGTKWGLFNAVTEFVDHSMGRTDDSRLGEAWFGRGHAMKAEALHILTDGSVAV